MEDHDTGCPRTACELKLLRNISGATREFCPLQKKVQGPRCPRSSFNHVTVKALTRSRRGLSFGHGRRAFEKALAST